MLLFTLAALGLSSWNSSPPSSAELVSSLQSVSPGCRFDVAVHFQIQPGWHIYWKNPGESGISPTLEWVLPKGWRAGPIEWPTPTRISTGGVVTYNYENDALLLVPITVPSSATIGRVTLRASAKWLVCREGCLPAKGALSIPIQIDSIKKSGSWFAKLAEVRTNLPRPSSQFKVSSLRRGDRIELSVSPPLPEGTVFFPSDTLIDPSAPQSSEHTSNGSVLQLRVSEYAPVHATHLRGLLVAPKGAKWAPNLDAITIDIPFRKKNS